MWACGQARVQIAFEARIKERRGHSVLCVVAGKGDWQQQHK
jgi:hypothetical protein